MPVVVVRAVRRLVGVDVGGPKHGRADVRRGRGYIGFSFVSSLKYLIRILAKFCFRIMILGVIRCLHLPYVGSSPNACKQTSRVHPCACFETMAREFDKEGVLSSLPVINGDAAPTSR